MQISTHTPNETQQLAQSVVDALIARKKEDASLLALEGDLGSGKTTFTQGLVEALGSSANVTSPTFVLMQRYPLQHDSFAQLFHIDAYRLESKDDFEALGLPEIMKDPKHLLVIEWPERGGALFEDAHCISFAHSTSESERTITTNLLS